MLDQEVTPKIISTIDDLDRQFAQTSLLKMPFVKGSFKKRVLKILDDFRITADQLLKLLYQQNRISVVRSSSCSSLIATGIDITPVRVLFFLDAIFNQKAALDPQNDVDRVKTPSIERLLFSQFFFFLSNMNGVSCSATLKQWAPGVAPLLESIIQLVSAERNRCVFTDPANYQFGFGSPSWLASSHNGMKLAESAMAYFAEEQRYADLNIQDVAEAIKVRVSALEAIKPEEVKSLGNLLELQAATCGTVGWQEIYLPIEIHLKKGQRFDYYTEMRRLSDEVGATPFFLRYISLDGLATT